jgi:trimethylamine--corrinoid protein Co-methyltransferase
VILSRMAGQAPAVPRIMVRTGTIEYLYPTGANLIHDIGILGCNNAISPEILVLCDELIEMSVHATRAVVPSAEELMLDMIDKVGPRGNYMAERHTRDNFRRFWHSPLFLRKRLKAGQQRPGSFGERLNERTRKIIETYEDQLLRTDTVRELDDLEASGLLGLGRHQVQCGLMCFAHDS